MSIEEALENLDRAKQHLEEMEDGAECLEDRLEAALDMEAAEDALVRARLKEFE